MKVLFLSMMIIYSMPRLIDSFQLNPVTKNLSLTLKNTKPIRNDTSTNSPVSSSTFQKEIKNISMAFPGGGIFFYWQIGAMSYLRDEAGYDLSNVKFTGASAGALAATLTVTGADFYEVTSLALKLSDEVGVWDRPMGLQGVWGSIIEEWLDELIPLDMDLEKINNEEKLSLLLSPVPNIFASCKVSSFVDRHDLIQCNLASVHIPWFLNGDFVFRYRDSYYIDGSFNSKPWDNLNCSNNIMMDWKQDPIMAKRSNEFIKLVSKDSIWSIFDQGREFARELDRQCGFALLSKQILTNH